MILGTCHFTLIAGSEQHQQNDRKQHTAAAAAATK